MGRKYLAPDAASLRSCQDFDVQVIQAFAMNTLSSVFSLSAPPICEADAEAHPAV
jgi:hypothetical protein